MTILLSRTDSIGDLVLTLPMAGMLKERFPDAKIIVLASDYAAPIAWCSEHVNEVWIWQELEWMEEPERLDRLMKANVDAIVHIFPNADIAEWAFKAGVKIRIGTSNRAFHWLTCNKLVLLSRKNSDLHEAQLNAMLLKPLLGKREFLLSDIPQYYGMHYIQPISDSMSSTYLDHEKFNLILHPLSQGSAPAWSLEHYQKLMELLPSDDVRIIITGTAAEAVRMGSFLGFAEDWGAVNCAGETSLDELITLIHHVDGLVAASTGPLHIAAAVGTRALGLFTQLRPMHAGRWMPLGTSAETMISKRECSKCTGGNTCACMNELSPERVAATVTAWLHDKRATSNSQILKGQVHNSQLQTTTL